MLQHGGANATFANLIAGLALAAAGAVALASQRGFGANAIRLPGFGQG
jgi:hypothetical protein